MLELYSSIERKPCFAGTGVSEPTLVKIKIKMLHTNWIQEIQSVKEVSGKCLNIIQALLDTGYFDRNRLGPEGHQDGRLKTDRSELT